MSTRSALWQSWAVFLTVAVLFALFWWFMNVGSIIASGCDPNDAAFAACDIAVGQLQRSLPWAGLTLPLAIAVELRWRWRGTVFLFAAAVVMALVARLPYA